MKDNLRFPSREELVAAHARMTWRMRRLRLQELAPILAELGADRDHLDQADELVEQLTLEATRRASGQPGATLP